VSDVNLTDLVQYQSQLHNTDIISIMYYSFKSTEIFIKIIIKK
jgi:hypothetical protein